MHSALYNSSTMHIFTSIENVISYVLLGRAAPTLVSVCVHYITWLQGA